MPEVENLDSPPELSWLDYKTIRQYQSMGDILEGSRSGTGEPLRDETKNGYNWLTKDP